MANISQIKIPGDSNVYDITLPGLTSTITELNYVDGVTSKVQDQLDNLDDKFDAYLPLAGGTLTGQLTVNSGVKVKGRYLGTGDDEGIVIEKCSNSYAGLCLGSPSGVRSVMYLMPDDTAIWRYSNGTSVFNAQHPGGTGTLALTSYVDTAKAEAIQYTNEVKAEIVGEAEEAYNTLLDIQEILEGDVTLDNLLSTYVTLGTAQTINSAKTFDGEQKMINSSYCPTMNDIASGVGCSLKNARACDNQLIAAEVYAPYTAKTDTTLNMTSTVGELPFYKITSVSSGAITGKSLMGKITVNGWEGNVVGNVTGNASTATALTSNNGSSTQPVYFSDGKPVACGNSLAVSITGNAATATKATQDGSGNVITSTYLKKSGDTATGNIIISKASNPYFGLYDSANGTTAYIQTFYTDGAVSAGFGFGWANSLTIDQSGAVFTKGAITEQGDLLSNKYALKTHNHELSDIEGINVTIDQINNLSGVTQDLQTQLNNKWDKDDDVVDIEHGGTGVTTLAALQELVLGGGVNTYILNQSNVINNTHIIDGAISAEKLDSSIGLVVAQSTEPTAESVMIWIETE